MRTARVLHAPPCSITGRLRSTHNLSLTPSPSLFPDRRLVDDDREHDLLAPTPRAANTARVVRPTLGQISSTRRMSRRSRCSLTSPVARDVHARPLPYREVVPDEECQLDGAQAAGVAPAHRRDPSSPPPPSSSSSAAATAERRGAGGADGGGAGGAAARRRRSGRRASRRADCRRDRPPSLAASEGRNAVRRARGSSSVLAKKVLHPLHEARAARRDDRPSASWPADVGADLGRSPPPTTCSPSSRPSPTRPSKSPPELLPSTSLRRGRAPRPSGSVVGGARGDLDRDDCCDSPA